MLSNKDRASLRSYEDRLENEANDPEAIPERYCIVCEEDTEHKLDDEKICNDCFLPYSDDLRTVIDFLSNKVSDLTDIASGSLKQTKEVMEHHAEGVNLLEKLTAQLSDQMDRGDFFQHQFLQLANALKSPELAKLPYRVERCLVKALEAVASDNEAMKTDLVQSHAGQIALILASHHYAVNDADDENAPCVICKTKPSLDKSLSCGDCVAPTIESKDLN